MYDIRFYYCRFLFRGGDKMDHTQQPSEVSIASSSSDASFDQPNSRMRESASGNVDCFIASDSRPGVDSLASRAIHSHHSPPFMTYVENPLQSHSQNNSSVGSVSPTVPECNHWDGYLPQEKCSGNTSADYETMVPVQSPPSKSNQATLLNSMKAMSSVHDQVFPTNPRANYDNVQLQPTQQNYENTAIKPVAGSH